MTEVARPTKPLSNKSDVSAPSGATLPPIHASPEEIAQALFQLKSEDASPAKG